MSASRCTCLWAVEPYRLLVEDPDCPATVIHITTHRKATPA